MQVLCANIVQYLESCGENTQPWTCTGQSLLLFIFYTLGKGNDGFQCDLIWIDQDNWKTEMYTHLHTVTHLEMSVWDIYTAKVYLDLLPLKFVSFVLVLYENTAYTYSLQPGICANSALCSQVRVVCLLHQMYGEMWPSNHMGCDVRGLDPAIFC